jgi:long-chain acyl-CoA synthetase
VSDLLDRLTESLRGWGDHPVLVELHSSGATVPIEAPELLQRVGETVDLLRRTGVRRDDVAALFLENSIDYVAVILALFEIGAVPVFAKPEYRRVELATLFRDIDPDVVLAGGDLLPMMREFLPGRGVIRREGCMAETGGVTTRGSGAIPGRSVSRLHPVDSVRRHHAEPGLSDWARSINCTYRGEGELLGSIATDTQYLHGARVLQEGLQGMPGESMLYPIPLSHIFTLVGCLFVPMLEGMTGILAATIHPRVLFEAFERLHVNHVTAVPEIYRLLLRSRKKSQCFPTLRTFVSGGSVLLPAEFDELSQAFSLEVLHGYGLTEFTPVSRNCRGTARPGTVGPVCEGLQVRIADPDAEGRGEILLRGPALFAGYYNRPRETRHAFREGWFHTGDRGHFSESHLVFDEEIKHTVKLNGVMVDLKEVKRAVLAATIASEARVFFEDSGIITLLEIPESADIDKEEKRLREVLVHQIARYKIPRRFARIS